MKTELVPYTESKRDQLEDELANKRELIAERRQGLDITLYWLRLTNTISLKLIDESANHAREFVVPNDKVLDARDHPEYYAHLAGLPPESYDDEDGA